MLSSAIRIATPLLFAALGGILSERAGVFAVGLEGMMLCGAFGAAITATLTGSPMLAILVAMLCGVALAATIAMVTLRFAADNMVTGLAANILAIGLTGFGLRAVMGSGAGTAMHVRLLQPWACPGLASLPGIGSLLFIQPPLTWVAFLGVVPMSLFLTRTRPGLSLRAAGENPSAAFAVGLNPVRLRAAAVLACGVIASLGGAVLVLQQVGNFTDNMTAGRGYLALAAIIVGRWRPAGALLACLAFGAAEALNLQVQILGLPISSYVVQMLPYVLALLVLVWLGPSARLPAAIGGHFNRERP